MLAPALGKSISGGKPLLPPRNRTVLQPVPTEAQGPGPHYSQTSVPGAEVLATGRMNALRQGRKRKLLHLWGLLEIKITWKLTRAAGLRDYQVPESPW